MLRKRKKFIKTLLTHCSVELARGWGKEACKLCFTFVFQGQGGKTASVLRVARQHAGKDWGQEEKGTTEDKMAGWRHRLNGREFE